MSVSTLFYKLEWMERKIRQLLARPFLYYTKGTYAPAYFGQTTAGATTYTVQAGFYTRFGRVVFFNGRVDWTAATGTGNAIVSLPFTAQNTTDMRYFVGVRTENVTFANGSIVGSIAPNQAFFTMFSPATNAVSAVVQVEAAGTIIFSGFFYV